MLRRPDFDPEADGRRPSKLRALLVLAALALVLLAASWLSPLGALLGTVASVLITLFGLFAGWFVTYVIKLPRDGRGVHERFGTANNNLADED